MSSASALKDQWPTDSARERSSRPTFTTFSSIFIVERYITHFGVKLRCRIQNKGMLFKGFKTLLLNESIDDSCNELTPNFDFCAGFRHILTWELTPQEIHENPQSRRQQQYNVKSGQSSNVVKELKCTLVTCSQKSKDVFCW